MTTTKPNSNERTRREWTLGSYSVLARTFLSIAAELVDSTGVEPDDRVLDVACGTGNVALTACRRGADVTGVDIAPAMLDVARERAAVIDADVEWRGGDAAALPFEDDAFDVTLSCLGHMFVPDADASGDELLRVTEPGGRIGYVSWTADSAIAAMMIALSEHLPPDPEPSPPPFLWGDRDTVHDRFGDRIEELRFDTGSVDYPAVSPAHFWESMTTDSGPIMVALESVDEEAMSTLRDGVIDVLDPYFSDVHNAVELEYRLVTAAVR